ncbi:hypothetical protein BDK51DRAFT_43883 [Blyttiomyces helicus]|uniref:Uncharacterized protein n=1 Tax=Blyttiomyces helicus TaxID=388810 RepID=A0A4P9WNQ7_9FUNG|nr:hypothetical protein BDK51DRAFT_43883 [Blyttiomyces helicus]|eukprot:RKO93733.1 hypothetical protein BDK51DRAFT_43883 [Blyttiomyces helicus]
MSPGGRCKYYQREAAHEDAGLDVPRRRGADPNWMVPDGNSRGRPLSPSFYDAKNARNGAEVLNRETKKLRLRPPGRGPADGRGGPVAAKDNRNYPDSVQMQHPVQMQILRTRWLRNLGEMAFSDHRTSTAFSSDSYPSDKNMEAPHGKPTSTGLPQKFEGSAPASPLKPAAAYRTYHSSGTAFCACGREGERKRSAMSLAKQRPSTYQALHAGPG